MRRLHRDERGIALAELLVVMIIGSLIAAAAVPSFLAARKGSSTASTTAGVITVWQGITAYRMDNNGRFPPAALLVPSSGTDYGSGLVIPNTQRRYVKVWPTDSNGNRLSITVAPGSGSSPASLPSAPGESGSNSGLRDASFGNATMVYSVANSGFTAWLAAYNTDGKMIFRRSVEATNLGAPIG